MWRVKPRRMTLHLSATGDKGRGWSWCWGRRGLLGDESRQRGHRARGVRRGRRRRGGGVLLRAGRGNGAGAGGQRERGRVQPSHGVLVPAAPHNRRLNPQQPHLIAVVSGTNSNTVRREKPLICEMVVDVCLPRWRLIFCFLKTFACLPLPSSLPSCCSSMCSEDLEALQAQKIWKKAIMLVWRAAANHRSETDAPISHVHFL